MGLFSKKNKISDTSYVIDDTNDDMQSEKPQKVFEAYLGKFNEESEHYFIVKDRDTYLFKSITIVDDYITYEDERLKVISKNLNQYNYFINTMKESMREWEKSYNDISVVNGKSWYIEFLNRKGRYSGTDIFPDNFDSVFAFLRQTFSEPDIKINDGDIYEASDLPDFVLEEEPINLEVDNNYTISDTNTNITNDSDIDSDSDVHEVDSFKVSNLQKESIRIGIRNRKSNYVMLFTHYKNPDDYELAFGDRNNLEGKVIADISIQIEENDYNSFVSSFNQITNGWEGVYPGDSEVFWSVKIEDYRDILVYGNGGFPENWNEFISLLMKYEILFKEKQEAEKDDSDLTGSDYSFEELVKIKFDDLYFVDIIIRYFKEELNEKDNVSKACFKDIMKYDDILNEFIQYLLKRTYDIENAITINGYTAKQIALLNPKFTASGVYRFMRLLRDNKNKAISIINGGFQNEDEFSLGFGKSTDDLDDNYAKKYLKEIEEDVDRKMMEMGLLRIINGRKVPVFGSSRTRWEIEKRLLKDRYNIDWKTPSEKNPFVNYN